MSVTRRWGTFVPMFASAVVMQALLSGSSLLVGLILIRRTNDLQYGYYVLILNLVLLSSILQGAYIQPQLVVRLNRASASERANLVGGLFREQRLLLFLIAAALFLLLPLLWFAGLVQTSTFLMMLGGVMAALMTLYREFFRMVLLGFRKPLEVLFADAGYVALLLAGAMLATLTTAPAVAASVTLGIAALVGGLLCARALWRFEPWNTPGTKGILWAIAPLGKWSVSGAAIYWVFSQGYNYLVAGVLSVPAVAALAATRLTIMPVNLLSSGIGTMMLPTVVRWLNVHSQPKVLRRLLGFTLLLSVAAICYFSVLWLFRGWVFAHVLKKQFVQRDTLLLLWFAVGLLMLCRDQLLYFLAARERFRTMTMLTLASALLALAVSYLALPRVGVMGALLGVLAGEVLNVGGLIALSAVESRRRA